MKYERLGLPQGLAHQDIPIMELGLVNSYNLELKFNHFILFKTSSADYSGYIQKKSLAQGMMDLALLSANINQMRYLLEYKDNQPYFATSFTLVVTSLFLQIAVSLTLIWNIRYMSQKAAHNKSSLYINDIHFICFLLSLDLTLKSETKWKKPIG